MAGALNRWIAMGCAWIALGVAGCAPKAIVLSPGPVAMDAVRGRVEGPAAWSLWIRESRDARPPERAGQKLGVMYTRFEKAPQDVFLDLQPAEYLRDQLRRYLLHRGLEASSADKARAFLELELEAFALQEAPGAVWDEVTVRVAYTVAMFGPGGDEVGKVRLEAQKQVKSPGNSARQAEKAFREVLLDTFQALERSREFQELLRSLGGA